MEREMGICFLQVRPERKTNKQKKKMKRERERESERDREREQKSRELIIKWGKKKPLLTVSQSRNEASKGQCQEALRDDDCNVE